MIKTEIIENSNNKVMLTECREGHTMLPFKEFKFGKASAELESTYYPNLLLSGYFNFENLTERVINHPEAFILGYKGSGKSALGEHLKLIADNDPKLFVNRVYLSDFPFTNFSKIVSGNMEPESKFPTAWSWVLLLSVIESFSKDTGSASNQNPIFSCSVDALRKIGFLPNPSLKQIVMTSSKKQFKAKLPPLFEATCDLEVKPGQDLQFINIVEHLKASATSFKSDSKHILVIDGLDDILTKRDIQYDSLAALILEVNRLNLLFYKTQTPAKIILLCRTELYERLPGPNKNKIRQDVGVELNWYQDPRKPEMSNLVKLVNLRANLSDEGTKNLFNRYFPKKLEDKNSIHFLLELTRHTPRDVIQLLFHIQKFTESLKPSKNEVLSGIRSYSINYFLPELRDEVVGYIPLNTFDLAIKIIGAIKRRHFKFEEILSISEDNNFLSEQELTEVLSCLFDCSAIGNLINKPGGNTFFSFRFRNRNAVLDLNQGIILHKGMWKALNLI